VSDRPLVSIIVPCFEQARFLGQALASVARQTYTEREVVVVDDGSRDDPAGVAAAFPDARVLRQVNQGTAAARNRGLRESRGPHVVFLDADDRLLPEALAAGVGALAEHRECGLVYGHVRVLSAEGGRCGCPPQAAVADRHYGRLLAGNFIWTPGAVMYRRAAVEAVGGFDRRAGGSADFDLNIRIARTWPVRCHGRTILEYREHPASQSQDVAYMLRSAMSVRLRHRRYVRGSRAARAALASGIRTIQADYGERLLDRVAGQARAGDWKPALRGLTTLLRYYPAGLGRRLVQRWR
jgi:glycosyltransferase involved in cell wall biosynthesis